MFKKCNEIGKVIRYESKACAAVIVIVMIFLFNPGITFGQVAVVPSEVRTNTFQVFNLVVNSSREIPTSSVRIVIPEEVRDIQPFLKEGWEVKVVKSGDNNKPGKTEIIWSGGLISEGMAENFNFGGNMPAAEALLKWNIYQTYRDGETVSWDLEEEDQPKKPDGSNDVSKSGPYSKTMVINDLATPEPKAVTASEMQNTNLPLILSSIALIVSGLAIGISLRQQ